MKRFFVIGAFAFAFVGFLIVAVCSVAELWRISNHNVPLVLFVGTGCLMFLGCALAYLQEGGWK